MSKPMTWWRTWPWRSTHRRIPTAPVQRMNVWLHNMSGREDWDLIVIGAGIYGIQAARTYLELHPSKRVVILESSDSVGGVWAEERVYDDFWTQTPLGILEFSDQSLRGVPKQEQYYGFFKAKHVSSYLKQYCSSHVYDGVSLSSRIRFGSRVTKVSKVDDNWLVEIGQPRTITHKAPKLVDASGLTSSPNFPDLTGREHFKGQIIHHKDFARFEYQIKSKPTKNVLVIGGAKSAADVAYGCTKAGQNVTWLIRRSGSGPAAFVSAKGSMGYANSNESFYTRFVSLFLTSLFSLYAGYTWILNALQRTVPGRRLLQRAWKRINQRAWREADYDRPDGKANGFYNLKPDTELFWQNDSTGINQRADFFDVIAKQTTVIRENISHLTELGVATEDGRLVKADVIVCATGWNIGHQYFDHETAENLGLYKDRGHPQDMTQWESLLADSDAQVIESFPILDSDWAPMQNAGTKVGEECVPYRLWKSMVPVQDHSIVFVGRLMLGNHFRASEVQALFTCAVLDKSLKFPTRGDMELDIAKTLAWCRRRYLNKGRTGIWFYWDMVPYTDMLLANLGLKSHRHQSWLKDIFRPCRASDLSGLIEEYRRVHAASNIS